MMIDSDGIFRPSSPADTVVQLGLSGSERLTRCPSELTSATAPTERRADPALEALYGIAYDVQAVLARRKVTNLRRLTEETAGGAALTRVRVGNP